MPQPGRSRPPIASSACCWPHAEREHTCKAMARWLVRSKQPVILIDCSDLKESTRLRDLIDQPKLLRIRSPCVRPVSATLPTAFGAVPIAPLAITAPVG